MIWRTVAFDSTKIASRRSRIGNSKVDEEAHRADLEMHVEAEALDDATNRPFKLGIRLGWAVTLKNVMRLAMLFVRLPTETSSMSECAQC